MHLMGTETASPRWSLRHVGIMISRSNEMFDSDGRLFSSRGILIYIVHRGASVSSWHGVSHVVERHPLRGTQTHVQHNTRLLLQS